jgi:hypothetical protein
MEANNFVRSFAASKCSSGAVQSWEKAVDLVRALMSPKAGVFGLGKFWVGRSEEGALYSSISSTKREKTAALRDSRMSRRISDMRIMLKQMQGDEIIRSQSN